MGTPVLPIPGQPKPMQDGEFQSQSRNSIVTWDLKNLDPPSNVYVTRDDQLMIVITGSLANAAVQVTARILTIDNVVVTAQTVVTVSGPDAATTGQLALSEGFLLSVTATSNNGGTFAPNYCRVMMFRSSATFGNVTQVLVAGTIAPSQPLSWPSMQPMLSAACPSVIRSIRQGSILPGVEWTFTVPPAHRFRLMSIIAHLVLSGTVATRVPVITFTDANANVFYKTSFLVQFGAGTVADMVISPNAIIGAIQNTSQFIYSAPTPDGLLLPASSTVAVLTTAFQAGDQWSAVTMIVEDWYDGQ